MLLAKARELQERLRHVEGLHTILVVPGEIKGFRTQVFDFPVVDPYVVRGIFQPEGFFEPDRDNGEWMGVFTVVISGAGYRSPASNQEIPVHWIKQYVKGEAYEIIDSEGTPVAIAKTMKEANAIFVSLWKPREVHAMSKWPQIMGPDGSIIRASAHTAGIQGLEYPWHA